jgi:hypothetical protein
MDESANKMGRFKKSWLLVKGASHALRMDKELFALPFIGGLLSLATVALAVVVMIFNPGGAIHRPTSSLGVEFSPLGTALGVLLLATLSVIATLMTGAITHGAIERFKGSDPTVGSSLRAARKRLGSLSVFALFSFTIGSILSYIAERIPGIGPQVLTWLAQASWGVASFFAIPIIVTSQTPVGPVRATKQSVRLMKQVWGESLIAGGTVSLIAVIISFAYLALTIAIYAGLNIVIDSSAIFMTLSIITVGGLLLISVLFSVLEAVVKAAIFYYATTGESPVSFDQRLMRQAFTHKQARNVFGS